MGRLRNRRIRKAGMLYIFPASMLYCTGTIWEDKLYSREK